MPDLYGMINVPTILWIDEEGRIARPNDVAFGSNDFKEMTGIDSERTWTACAPGCAARAPR